MKSIKFNSNNYINLGLTAESVSQTENVLLLGNVTNFFGCLDKDGNLDMENTHKDIIQNNFIWLSKHLLEFKSKLTVITSKADIKEYWTPFFKDLIINYPPVDNKKAKVSYTTAALEDFAKKFKITEDLPKLYVELIKFMQEKNMKFDKIIMNPPYNCGNKCISEARNILTRNGKMTVLAPLSCYKTLDNYKYIKSLELVDPTVFQDADITKNLCIVQMDNIKDDTKSYSDYEMETYNNSYNMFYYTNIAISPSFNITSMCHMRLNEISTLNQGNIFFIFFRTASDGVHKSGKDVDFNVSRTIGYKELPYISDNGVPGLLGGFIIFNGPIERDNFTTWWYTNAKQNLADSLIKGLNKDAGPISEAIPRIDWKAISNHPLWKAGDYDSAVLDVMGLKWNENKDGVVRK